MEDSKNLREKNRVLYANTPSVDPILQRTFNQALREQLNDLLATNLCNNHSNLNTIASSVEKILRNELRHEEWVEVFSDMNLAFLPSYKKTELTEEEKTKSYINQTGLIISVKDCINTINDIYRVKSFIRSVDKALTQLDKQESIHIVYPACGPFAPLLLPLISYYKVHHNTLLRQIKLTLIDIQPGATKVLENLVEDLKLYECNIEILCMDVMEYIPSEGIDLLLMESFQSGLSHEGHMAFALHLIQFMNQNGVLLPEKISITAYLSNCEREYNEQWSNQSRAHSDLINSDIHNQRIALGELLEVSKESLQKITPIALGNSIKLIECNQVYIPKNISDIKDKTLIISAVISVFGDEHVAEYDSGISHPLPDMSVCIDFKPTVPEPDDLLVRSGDKLKFYYKMGSLPGFLPTVAS